MQLQERNFLDGSDVNQVVALIAERCVPLPSILHVHLLDLRQYTEDAWPSVNLIFVKGSLGELIVLLSAALDWNILELHHLLLDSHNTTILCSDVDQYLENVVCVNAGIITGNNLSALNSLSSISPSGKVMP